MFLNDKGHGLKHPRVTERCLIYFLFIHVSTQINISGITSPLPHELYFPHKPYQTRHSSFPYAGSFCLGSAVFFGFFFCFFLHTLLLLAKHRIAQCMLHCDPGPKTPTEACTCFSSSSLSQRTFFLTVRHHLYVFFFLPLTSQILRSRGWEGRRGAGGRGGRVLSGAFSTWQPPL